MKRVSATNSRISQACLYPTLEPKVQRNLSEKALPSESTRNHGFEKLLLEAMDEGMALLGELSKQTLYSHLEKTLGIRKQDIPSRIEEFTKAIEKVFGEGAKILEIQMMRRLYEKVGRDFEYVPDKDELMFTEYVEAVRAHYTGFTPFLRK